MEKLETHTRPLIKWALRMGAGNYCKKFGMRIALELAKKETAMKKYILRMEKDHSTTLYDRLFKSLNSTRLKEAELNLPQRYMERDEQAWTRWVVQMSTVIHERHERDEPGKSGDERYERYERHGRHQIKPLDRVKSMILKS